MRCLTESMAQSATRLLRESQDALFVRLRELPRDRDIHVETSALAAFFPDDVDLEFGVVVTAEGRVYEFDLVYPPAVPSDNRQGTRCSVTGVRPQDGGALRQATGTSRTRSEFCLGRRPSRTSRLRIRQHAPVDEVMGRRRATMPVARRVLVLGPATDRRRHRLVDMDPAPSREAVAWRTPLAGA